jgi:predicted dehydrogenase
MHWTGFLFEIHGTEGDLAIAPADPRQAINVQVSEFAVRGAQRGKSLTDLPIPESYRWVPPTVPVGLPFNVAQLFVRMAEGFREGKSVSPDFDVAIKRHQLLDAIQKASDTRDPPDSVAIIVQLLDRLQRRRPVRRRCRSPR